jgi:uncharacterized protein (DUF2267 family)
MEKLKDAVEILFVVLGTVSAVCGVLAKWLPEGKAKRVARDLGMRVGDALHVLNPKLTPDSKDSNPPQVKP